jgi:hypothetical protein
MCRRRPSGRRLSSSPHRDSMLPAIPSPSRRLRPSLSLTDREFRAQRQVVSTTGDILKISHRYPAHRPDSARASAACRILARCHHLPTLSCLSPSSQPKESTNHYLNNPTMPIVLAAPPTRAPTDPPVPAPTFTRRHDTSRSRRQTDSDVRERGESRVPAGIRGGVGSLATFMWLDAGNWFADCSDPGGR